VVSYNASRALRSFSDPPCIPILVLMIPDSSSRVLWQTQAETHGSESGETWREMSVNFAGEVSLPYSAGIFKMPQTLTTWGRRFYFYSEGSRAAGFCSPWKTIASAGFEPLGYPMASTITSSPPSPTKKHINYAYTSPCNLITWCLIKHTAILC
jgi:hypothetical protein